MKFIDVMDAQEKAKYIHDQACVYLLHFTSAVQCVFSGSQKMALLLTLTKSEIERHAVSFSSAGAVAVYEPNKAQLNSIVASLFHDQVTAYVFTVFDAQQGLDGIAVSFAATVEGGWHRHDQSWDEQEWAPAPVLRQRLL